MNLFPVNPIGNMSSRNLTNSRNLQIAFQIVILLAAFTILFGTAITKLIQDWAENSNYSHGFLIPFISIYMIWHKRSQLIEFPLKPSAVGLLVIIFGMIVFIIGNVAAELFTMRIAIVITIVGLCTYFLGIRVTIAIAVPLSYLLFMVPLPAIIWNKIAFPLQLLAAKLSSNIIQFMGIPLLREGNVLHLPNITLEVIDACSGLRSLISLLSLSAAFAYVVKITIVSKWFLFISAIPIAIIVNIFRLASTAILAVYVGPETAHGFLHDLSGIIVFITAFAMFYGLYAAIQRIETRATMK